MRRAATSVFLAGWIGFLAVSGLTAVLAMFAVAAIAVPVVPGLADTVKGMAERLATGGNVEILAATIAALLQFMIAAFLALALWLVHGRDAQDQTAGERLAMSGLGAIGALVLTVHLGGFELFDRFGSLIGIETVVALSIVAVAFDRLIAIDEDDPADERDFHAAVTLIGQQMARDAVVNAKPDADLPNKGEGGR